jgi:hypothetical protein
LIQLPDQISKIRNAYWVARPGVARLLTLLLSFVTNLPLAESWLPIALFITILTVVVAVWGTIRGMRHGGPGIPEALWFVYLAFAPPLALFVVSQFQPVYIERALLPSGVFFLMWVGWALLGSDLPVLVRRLTLVVLLVGMGVGIFHHLSYQGFPYAPYVQLDRYLRGQQEDGDVIIHSNKLSALPAIYYDRDLKQRYLTDPPGTGSDTLAPPTQEVLGLHADPTLAEAVGGASRVWFVIFRQAIEEYRESSQPEHPHLTWLRGHYDTGPVESWGDLSLYVFTR